MSRGAGGGSAWIAGVGNGVANGPRVLLADEPTGNLDPGTAEHVFDALGQIVRASGLAALVGTHNLDLARAWTGGLRCERVG